MTPDFHADYQERLLTVRFTAPTALETSAQVLEWKSAWLVALKTWHSPYKALVDCSSLTVDNPALEKDLARFFTLLKGLFLQKIAGFGLNPAQGHALFPFPIFATEMEARTELGVRGPRVRLAEDFRSSIQFDNHFQTHTMEMRFLEPVRIDSPQKIQILKEKLLNNLRLWHSHWNWMIDCHNFELDEALTEDWNQLVRFFQGFFLKDLVGYQTKPEQKLPFRGFRARHRAAAMLESEGAFSGAEANCQSRKKP
jgi:hypothetical protein